MVLTKEQLTELIGRLGPNATDEETSTSAAATLIMDALNRCELPILKEKLRRELNRQAGDDTFGVTTTPEKISRAGELMLEIASALRDRMNPKLPMDVNLALVSTADKFTVAAKQFDGAAEQMAELDRDMAKLLGEA